jgi:hypothetical protein
VTSASDSVLAAGRLVETALAEIAAAETLAEAAVIVRYAEEAAAALPLRELERVTELLQDALRERREAGST